MNQSLPHRAVVIDTMVVGALLNPARNDPNSGAYRSLIGGRPVVASFVTVAELRYGSLKAGWGELRRRALDRDLAKLTIVQPDDELIRICALLRARCETRGHGLGDKIHEADRWIAATAVRMAVPLVSDDRIYSDVEGLTVYSRPTPTK